MISIWFASLRCCCVFSAYRTDIKMYVCVCVFVKWLFSVVSLITPARSGALQGPSRRGFVSPLSVSFSHVIIVMTAFTVSCKYLESHNLTGAPVTEGLSVECSFMDSPTSEDKKVTFTPKCAVGGNQRARGEPTQTHTEHSFCNFAAALRHS